MTELEKQELFDKYNENTHTLGRICSAIALVSLLGAPFLIFLILRGRRQL